LGVILFQEQVLKVARDLAGFTAGQGERLRRALGAKRAEAEIERLRADFLAGARHKGAPADIATAVFEQLRAFSGYSFAKSHSAAFAVLVYQSAWLKRYHPAAFYTALLNNQPMGFWNAAVLVNEVRRQGLAVLPVDIHHSQAACTVEAGGVRLGLALVKGLGEREAARIVAGRDARPFETLPDFCRRTGLSHRLVEHLIMAGTLDGWGTPRRHLLWELGALPPQEDGLDLVFTPEPVSLPPLTTAELALAEQALLGLSPGDHIMTFYRAALGRAGIRGSRALAGCGDGEKAQVAGLLVVHQAPPTAKGFRFLTLEDEDGLMNVVVRPSVVAQLQGRPSGHGSGPADAALLLVAGVVQRDEGVIHLLAERIRPLVL
jgi:error-prone DNA polymerase